MQAEEAAAETVAAARQAAADLLTDAREKARTIRARAEALVTRMSRLVSKRAERDVARIEREHEAELKALDEEIVSGPGYRAAAASVAASLLGLDDEPSGRR